MVEEEKYRELAAQLRKPEGEFGLQVAGNLSRSNRFLNHEVIRLLKPGKGEHILEIGMANGAFVNEVLSQSTDITYTGCDFSADMVSEASALNITHLETGAANFIHSDASHMPFEDNAFDKVFAVNTLYFWEPEAEMLEIRRVLKRGGTLILGIRPEEVMQHYPFTRYGFTMYDQQKLGDLLAKHGFKVIHLHAFDEEDQEMNGEMIPVKGLIACAEKV